jgi:putative transposase
VTTYLAQNHSLIVVEDLKVKNLTRSAKGTVENPGKNVKAKAGLNRVLLDRAPGMFRQFLAYKCAWTGATLRKRNPAYTSQKCSACGCIDKRNRKAVSWFECVQCGHAESAHTNAAKNIVGADGLLNPHRSVEEYVNPGVAPGCLVEAETQRGAAA